MPRRKTREQKIQENSSARPPARGYGAKLIRWKKAGQLETVTDRTLFSAAPVSVRASTAGMEAASSDTGKWLHARVKFFDDEKGFGFVILTGGIERFMHVAVLKRCGIDHLEDDCAVLVRVGYGRDNTKPPEVLEIKLS